MKATTTISAKSEKLLSSFPRPPTGTSSPRAKTPLPSPGLARPGNFEFISVALSRDYDSDSLYDYPEESYHEYVDPAAKPPSSTNNAEPQLILDNPSQTYAPSETITGYIVGWDPTCTHLHIILEGRAKTYIRRDKTQYKDRVPLLYQITHLDPGGQGGVPRFSLTVPERTTSGLDFDLNACAPTDPIHGRYWTHQWPVQDPYEHDAGHPLPPTMSMPLRSCTALASHAEGWGQISYKLIAVRSERSHTTGKFTPDASCQIPIRLTTRRLPSARVQELIRIAGTSSSDLSVQTTQLLKARRLSLREQLFDSFSTSAPIFCFRGNISSAKLSTPGADVKTTISVSVLPPPPGKLYNFAIPDISIKALNFRVRSFTGLRIIRKQTFDEQNQATARSDTFKYSELQTSQLPSGAVFKPKDGGFEGQSCVSIITLPKSILPSCKTYNVWRSYRLKCDVVFSVAGKEVSMTSKSDLNIIAKTDKRDDSGGDEFLQDLKGEDELISLEMARAMVKRMGV